MDSTQRTGEAAASLLRGAGCEDDEESHSHRLQHVLHKPVAFGILPVFALANTGVVLGADAVQRLAAGFLYLKLFGAAVSGDDNLDAMDFEVNEP